MKIGIYCGVDVGQVKDQSIDYIGVDHGITHLIHQGIKPIKAIGDMDSIVDKHLLDDLDTHLYSSIKDDTDTALAIRYAIEQGYDEIDLYGVTQRRMDHFMAVIALLEKFQDVHIVIYDEWNKIQVLKAGKHQMMRDDYHYFSIFAFDQSFITLTDCHYPLDHYLLCRCDPLCVSNQMNDDHVIIENSATVLFMQSQ